MWSFGLRMLPLKTSRRFCPARPEQANAVIVPMAIARRNFDSGMVKILGTASFCVDRATFERVLKITANQI
jgi:hypothetical protein